MSIEIGHTLLFEGNVTSVLGLLVVFPAMASGFGPQIFYAVTTSLDVMVQLLITLFSSALLKLRLDG